MSHQTNKIATVAFFPLPVAVMFKTAWNHFHFTINTTKFRRISDLKKISQLSSQAREKRSTENAHQVPAKSLSFIGRLVENTAKTSFMCRMPLTYMYNSHTLLIHVLVYWRPMVNNKQRFSSLAEMEDIVATPFKKYCSVVNTCQYTLKVQCADNKRPSPIAKWKGFDDSLLQTLASNVNAECRYKSPSPIPKWKGFDDSLLQTLASIVNAECTDNKRLSNIPKRTGFSDNLLQTLASIVNAECTDNKQLSHIPKWKGFNDNLLPTLTSTQSKQNVVTTSNCPIIMPKWTGFNDNLLQTLASIQSMQNIQTTTVPHP